MTGHGATAAIDCGTNSTRLLIVGADGTVRTRQMRITRLGQGVDATNTLSPAALTRTLDVLRDYRVAMDAEGVGRARLVATSAVRDATNGEDFLRAASEVTRCQAELLPGDEEGRLAFRGATADLDAAEGDDVVVDIGGGSTELITESNGAIRAVSLQLGCVRLSERYQLQDPPPAADHAGAVTAIEAELDRAVSEVPELVGRRPGGRLIGLAGTVSTLAALDLGLVTYDRSRVHHAVLSGDAVARWCTVLGAETAAERATRPGMLEGRQDVIVGGALVLRQVMERLGFASCLVSESDILDGLIESLQD
jgi:exopolyphosphatase/guanosine-5'-triphosphate,3'-diphosphate pyrophosphatase